MITDPVADLLTRIRNAQQVNRPVVRVSSSKMAKGILEVLKEEGFIESYQMKKDRDGKFDELEVALRYYPNGDPMLTRINRVSKPGRRYYSCCSDLAKVNSGLGILVVSTSQGVMSDRDARKKNIGGEVLARVS